MPRKRKTAAPDPDPARAAAPEYYSYSGIMEIDAVYRMIIGQRSNGKTFGWCRLALEHFFDFGLASAYVRRLDEMIKPKIIADLFTPHIDYIIEKSGGDWNGFEYRSNCFILVRREKDSLGNAEIAARDTKPFCRTYAISTVETTKGPDRGAVWSICFDEFITRSYYLANEFILFQNVCSSIIRDRPGVHIFMLANTVSKFCPYFREMGLYRITKQEQGTIDVYKIGKSGSQIAVEYCAELERVKKNVSKYFAFDNPQLEMIQAGAWELALYRHAPPELSQYPIAHTFFVIHEGRTVQGDIHLYKGYPIIFFHPKTTEIQRPEKTIIYDNDTITDGNPLHSCAVANGACKAMRIIFDLIKTKRTFYADNDTGETVAAWLRPQRLAAR
mgnify:FL=1